MHSRVLVWRESRGGRFQRIKATEQRGVKAFYYKMIRRSREQLQLLSDTFYHLTLVVATKHFYLRSD